MTHPLPLDLSPELRNILTLIADTGLLGSTSAEVAAYLIMRGVDDLTRAGVVRVEQGVAGG